MGEGGGGGEWGHLHIFHHFCFLGVVLYEQILYCTQNKIKELASSGAKSHKSRPSFVKVSKQEAMKVVPL